jgi:hypothetical protein
MVLGSSSTVRDRGKGRGGSNGKEEGDDEAKGEGDIISC